MRACRDLSRIRTFDESIVVYSTERINFQVAIIAISEAQYQSLPIARPIATSSAKQIVYRG